MRILIFAWRDIKNPKAGGSEVYFHEIAKRWVSKGHQVTMICGGWKGCLDKEYIDGIRTYRVGGEYSLYLKAPLKYFSLNEKFDRIIDVENGLSFCTPLFARPKKFLHIHHVHKDVWFREMSKITGSIGYFFETKLLPLIYKKTKVLTISLGSHNEIEKELGLDTVGIIEPGYTIGKYKKVKKTKHPTILFLNRLKKYKGINILIRAFREVQDKYPNAELVIAGDGDYMLPAKRLADELGINYIFLGRVSEEKKYELMQSSWLFVNPSHKEGFGIVNLEAAHFGLPVIGSDVPGIRDSMINGSTGLLFKEGDYKELAYDICLLLKDRKLKVNYSIYSEYWSRRFDWDKAADKYLEFISQ